MLNAKARRRRKLRKNLSNDENKKSFNILHTNIRGFNSKADSLKAICKAKNVDVVTINETQLRGKKKIIIPGFEAFCKNRQKYDGGGIATCVKDVHAKDTLQIFEGNDENEILITRHSQFNFVINLINIYGCQESRVTSE